MRQSSVGQITQSVLESRRRELGSWPPRATPLIVTLPSVLSLYANVFVFHGGTERRGTIEQHVRSILHRSIDLDGVPRPRHPVKVYVQVPWKVVSATLAPVDRFAM